MEDNRVHLSPERMKRLRRDLDHLVNVKRPALAERLRHATQQGDLSENTDYQVGKAEEALLERRIRQLEAMLRGAVVIEETQRPKHEVGLGSRVTVIRETENAQETFVIVGTVEADPANGRISNESPVGQALMARKVGECVIVQTPARDIVFKITVIE